METRLLDSPGLSSLALGTTPLCSSLRAMILSRLFPPTPCHTPFKNAKQHTQTQTPVNNHEERKNKNHKTPPNGSPNATFLLFKCDAGANASPNTAPSPAIVSLSLSLPSGSPSSSESPPPPPRRAACSRRRRCSSTRFQRSGSRHFVSFLRRGVIWALITAF